MDFLYYPLGFLLLLGVVVTIHEFGHFIVARWSGVHVLRFSVGFGRSLWTGRDRLGTEFTLALIPLGGYVRMLDDRDTDQADLLARVKSENPSIKSYMDLTPWWRIAIALAGPAANFVLAVMIYWLIAVVGTLQPVPMLDIPDEQTPLARAGLAAPAIITGVDGENTVGWQAVQLALASRLGDSGAIEFVLRDLITAEPRTLQVPIEDWHSGDVEPDFLRSLGLKPTTFSLIGQVVADSAAERAGLAPGDFIVGVDAAPLRYWRDWDEIIKAHPGRVITLDVVRDGRPLTLQARPDSTQRPDGTEIGFLGVGSPYVEVSYGFFAAARVAVVESWDKTVMTLGFLKKMILGDVSVRNLVGPVGIAQIAGEVAQSGWLQFITIMALMSISIGIMNLLPIPILDGGHVLFNGVELLTGKPVPERVQVVGVQIGLAILGGAFIMATYNDILRIF